MQKKVRKTSLILYPVILLLASIAITAFLDTGQEDPTGIFPEYIGDMRIVSYFEGVQAISEVKSLHRPGSMELTNAYIVEYRGTGKVKFWVSESGDAGSLFSAMKDMVGKTGIFSEPVSLEGTIAYHVTGPGGYHYFWVKGNRVFWVQIDYPDKAFQRSIVEESIKNI